VFDGRIIGDISGQSNRLRAARFGIGGGAVGKRCIMIEIGDRSPRESMGIGDGATDAAPGTGYDSDAPPMRAHAFTSSMILPRCALDSISA
jgi:hypothetical protein